MNAFYKFFYESNLNKVFTISIVNYINFIKMLNPKSNDSLHQSFFTISTPEFYPIRLIDKHVPAVDVDLNTNVIKCKDADA